MYGIQLSPTPVQGVQCVLVLRWEFGAVAERYSRRRTGANVQHRRQVVSVERHSLSGSVPPSVFRAAGHMTDSRGAIPGCVEIVFHVRVVSKQLSVTIDRGIENVPET